MASGRYVQLNGSYIVEPSIFVLVFDGLIRLNKKKLEL